MKITGGHLRGRTWPVPVGRGVRPTASRVREALFSVLGQDLSGWTVLDAFGGSGLLGVEAHSRSASSVQIMEQNAKAASHIQKAIRALELPVQVRRGDVRTILKTGRFDLVLMDPPYSNEPLPWIELGADAALRVLVIETGAHHPLPERVRGLVRDRMRRYGDTQLGIYWRTLEGDE